MRASLPGEIVQRLPYGVVVVGPGGLVLAHNAAAARALGGLDGDGRRRCHELLACRAPGGPCAEGCLAARAAAAPAPLPEIRIDAARRGGASAVWVTAAPLGSGDEALLHLRPGDARDRRRRSDPHWLRGPELRVRALGRTELETPEGPLGGRWLEQRPGQVLKLLLCERDRALAAEEIAEALWPRAGRGGLANVRYFVHRLREHLEPDRPRRGPSAFVVAVRGGYALDRRHVHVVADEFERHARDGLAAAGRGDAGAARPALEAAAALYRGDFLADEPYAEWAFAERDRLRALAARVLRALARLAAEAADLEAAGGHLERLSALAPYDADVHRDLLAVWLAQGRRSDAARAFAAFRVRLLRAFGEEPGFDLASLAPLALAHSSGARWATLPRTSAANPTASAAPRAAASGAPPSLASPASSRR